MNYPISYLSCESGDGILWVRTFRQQIQDELAGTICALALASLASTHGGRAERYSCLCAGLDLFPSSTLVNKITGTLLQIVGGLIVLHAVDGNLGLFKRKTLGSAYAGSLAQTLNGSFRATS